MKLIDKAYDPDNPKLRARIMNGVQFIKGEAELPDTEEGIKKVKAILRSYNVEVEGMPEIQSERIVVPDAEDPNLPPSMPGSESADDDDEE